VELLAVADPPNCPDDLSPIIPDHVSVEQRIALWVDLMNAGEQFLLAGLRREIGPDGDLEAAYRQRYAEQREEHDRAVLHMMEVLSRAKESHGG
jgi:hypothetical protein